MNFKSCEICGFRDDLRWRLESTCSMKKRLPLERDTADGSFYLCPECNRRWFVDSVYNYPIAETSFRLLKAWEQSSPVLSEKQKSVLSSIGASPVDRYGNLSDFLRFPCSITFRDGTQSLFCEMRLAKHPIRNILELRNESLYFIDDIKDLKSSEMTLPNELRVASVCAPETTYGNYPFDIQLSNGQVWRLQGGCEFAQIPGTLGKDYSLPTTDSVEALDFYKKYKEVTITYVLGRWDDALAESRLPTKK